MLPIKILSIKFRNNACSIELPFEVEIFYEIKKNLEKDFELKFIYIVSASNQTADQELESFYLPSNKKGKFKVFLNIKAPDFTCIPFEQITGVTVILFIVSYDNQEFIRIGYYLNNESSLNEGEPIEFGKKPPLKLIQREILTSKPRVTIFPFNLEEKLKNNFE